MQRKFEHLLEHNIQTERKIGKSFIRKQKGRISAMGQGRPNHKETLQLGRKCRCIFCGIVIKCLHIFKIESYLTQNEPNILEDKLLVTLKKL